MHVFSRSGSTLHVQERPRRQPALSAAVERAVSQFAVPGAQVALLLDGEIEQIEVGSAGIGRRSPVLAETRFPLGSATKPFTATLALQLVSDGALTLEDPIGDLLPAGDHLEVLGDLTLRQLLSHSSGLENDH